MEAETMRNEVCKGRITYGIVLRATKDAIVKINTFLQTLDKECEIVYQKSSPMKLVIKEEVY